MGRVARVFSTLFVGALLGGLLFVASSVASPLAPVMSKPAAAASSGGCGYPPGSKTCQKCPSLSIHPPKTVPGGTVVVTGCGFGANAEVTINVCGLETIHTTANSHGRIHVKVTIPSNAPPGNCVITATGLGANGKVLTLSQSIVLTSSGSSVPPTHTGEFWAGWVYWLIAGGAALLGFLLVFFGRRRNSVSTT